jgi:hypothetical protein
MEVRGYVKAMALLPFFLSLFQSFFLTYTYESGHFGWNVSLENNILPINK